MSTSLFKNSFFNIASKGFNLLYPMITSAYISRIFHAEGLGLIMFAINIVTYFSLAASLGVPNYAVKLLAPLRNCKRKLDVGFSEIALIIGVSSILASIAYYSSIPLIFNDNTNLYYAGIVLGLIIITNIFNYDWLFEAMEDYKFLALRSIVIKCILIAIMFIIVRTNNDLVLYCIIYAGISVLSNLWNVISINRFITPHYCNLNIKRHIKPILFLCAASFATEIYTLLDSTMLGVMCEPSSLGYYSNSSRVVRSLYGALFAIIAVFNPRLCKYYGNEQYEDYKQLFAKYFDLGVMLSVPTTCFVFITSPFIINLLFGSGFAPAIYILKLLSPLIVVFTMATIFGHIPLVIYGKERYLLLATCVGACLNFFLNQILIPLYQHNGAAIASLISEFFVTVIMTYFSLKVVNIQLLIKHNTASVCLSSLVMLILTYLIKTFIYMDNEIFMFALLIMVAFISYVLMLLLFKHSIANTIKDKIMCILVNVYNKS